MALPKIDIRPRRSMAFFAVLAILMVIASYLFVLVLAAACVYVPYLISSSGSSGFQIIAMFLFGIVIAATMLWSLVPRRDKFVAPGLPLFRQDQQRLFAELDDIAASLNERLPSEVYLIPDANAFVADRGGVIGFGSRRVMGLGLPLFPSSRFPSFERFSPTSLPITTVEIPASAPGCTVPRWQSSASFKTSDRSAS